MNIKNLIILSSTALLITVSVQASEQGSEQSSPSLRSAVARHALAIPGFDREEQVLLPLDQRAEPTYNPHPNQTKTRLASECGGCCAGAVLWACYIAYCGNC